jgi:hypothetical protein
MRARVRRVLALALAPLRGAARALGRPLRRPARALGRPLRGAARVLGRPLRWAFRPLGRPLRWLGRQARRPVPWLAGHRRPLLAAALTTAAGLILLIVFLGRGDDDEALGGRAKEVVAVMDDFERAVRARDYGRICSELFTIEAREAAGGGNCPALLAQSTDGIQDLQVRLESIVVRGNAATARVNARAKGQEPATDTVRFVRREGRFRIASLSP